jgi:hypothetical protein
MKMGRNASAGKPDVMEWLLEEDNPSVRYLALLHLLDRKETDPAVVQARRQIMLAGAVPRILGAQTAGRWNADGRFYLDKYRGTVWQLIILAEHEADGENEQVRAACEHVLACSQDPESFGFSVYQGARGAGGRHGDVIPCLTGNMAWSLIKLGYLADARVKKAVQWITSYQRFDDGAARRPGGWPYDRFEMCWGTHTCHMGAVKALKALSAIPKRQRGPEVRRTIDSAVEYLLIHHIHKRSHDLDRVARPGWLKLQFPLMYQTDILEIAGLLAELGVADQRMSEAMDIIRGKQGADGRWPLEATFNGRYWVSIEKKGAPSKWITCRALRAIRGFEKGRAPASR